MEPNMKKATIFILSISLVFSSCMSYGGAMAGGAWGGALLGGALGGIIGGPRGHDIGTIVGGLGGLAAGAAVDASVQKERQSGTHSVKREETYEEEGDDAAPRRNAPQRQPLPKTDNVVYTPISIGKLQLIDQNEDYAFNRNETCTLTFEVRNNTNETVEDVQLYIDELNDDKHLHYSTLPLIESIAPKKRLRITAYIYADQRLKDGTAHFAIMGRVGNEEAVSLIEFTAPMKK